MSTATFKTSLQKDYHLTIRYIFVKHATPKVIKGKVPCQAVYNDMFVDDIPTEPLTLEKLEQILIAQRIVFEKIVVMPKGQQRKIKGAICNVPVECDKTCQTLLYSIGNT